MGAWGTEPFQNDSALDWLYPIQDKIERTFEKALRPLKKTKHVSFVFPKKLVPEPGRHMTPAQQRERQRLIRQNKVERAVSYKFTNTAYCQPAALAAVVLVRSFPALHLHGGWNSDGSWNSDKGTLIEQALKVLDQLLKDEGFISSWDNPEGYVAVVKAERKRVRALMLKHYREKEEACMRAKSKSSQKSQKSKNTARKLRRDIATGMKRSTQLKRQRRARTRLK